MSNSILPELNVILLFLADGQGVAKGTPSRVLSSNAAYGQVTRVHRVVDGHVSNGKTVE